MAIGDNEKETQLGALEALRNIFKTIFHPVNKYIRVVDVGAEGIEVPSEEKVFGPLSNDPTDQANEKVVMDIQEGLVLEMIQFGGDSAELDLILDRYDSQGNLVPMSHLLKDASDINEFFRISEMYADSNKVEANHSGVFVIELFDTTAGGYKISFKDGINIKCPFGCKIIVRNSASQQQNVGCVAQYRKTGV